MRRLSREIRAPGFRPGKVPPEVVVQRIGVDAANIGNHEFNYGLPFLRQAIAGAAFPYVNANVHVDDGDGNPDNDAHAFTPWVILARSFVDEAGVKHPLKIGVIGFVPPQILMWDKQHLEGRLTVRDIQATARRLVPQMRAQGADTAACCGVTCWKNVPGVIVVEPPGPKFIVVPVARDVGAARSMTRT